MKGIILAGGRGTRLGDCTRAVSKQLLPVYDKPMIYYPLSVLLQAGIKDILIITAPESLDAYRNLLGTGSAFCCSFIYEVQEEPNGLAEAFTIGKKHFTGHSTCLILGDNIFYGQDVAKFCDYADFLLGKDQEACAITGYRVAKPSAYGVVEINKVHSEFGGMKVFDGIKIIEKPDVPASEYAVPGIYFFDRTVYDKVSKVRPSARGELEITELISMYMRRHSAKVCVLSRETMWFDAGTFDGLLDVAEFVSATQRRTGQKVGCPYEAAKRSCLI